MHEVEIPAYIAFPVLFIFFIVNELITLVYDLVYQKELVDKLKFVSDMT